MKACPDCNGDGVIEKGTDDEQRCPTCGGLGVVPDNDDDHEEVLNTSHSFPAADGSSRRQRHEPGGCAGSFLTLESVWS